VTSGRLAAERVLAAGFLLLALLDATSWAAEPPATAGEAIYLNGVLGSGAPLQGVRQGGGRGAQGAGAACVNCHQRSGLGSAEGSITIPPITGQYLFHPRGARQAEPILPYVEWMHGNRDPYTDATLARAIREGVDSGGRPLSDLMPRFALNDADMTALIDYLKKLDARPNPGITDKVLHFATVITPDADPIKRRGMLDVMQRYFDDKNTFPFGPSPTMRTSGKTEYSKSMYMANRRWQLHVWELTGPAPTWRAQLEQHLAQEPVLAVVSGLAGSNWAPVHEFCEREHLPCLFPNVEVPVDNSADFYSVYFSKGVLLEAELIAKAIAGPGPAGPAPTSVQQVYRAGDSGESAASVLAAALKRGGIAVRNQVIRAGGHGQGVAEALRAVSKADVLVLWLRPDDLAALGDTSPAPASSVFISGLMSGLEGAPLPQDWRRRAKMVYPFDLPERRSVRVAYPLGWFSMRRIPVVAEQVQADTYLACGLLAETLKRMADNIVQPYLVEQLQTSIERRIITGYYPHMVLGSNERFASKGGYIVHFAQASGKRLVAESDWVVP
jgi:hypothetical protein